MFSLIYVVSNTLRVTDGLKSRCYTFYSRPSYRRSVDTMVVDRGTSRVSYTRYLPKDVGR